MSLDIRVQTHLESSRVIQKKKKKVYSQVYRVWLFESSGKQDPDTAWTGCVVLGETGGEVQRKDPGIPTFLPFDLHPIWATLQLCVRWVGDSIEWRIRL